MVIEKYGIVLRRLTHDKIELVRNWRNDPKISQYMEFQDYITPEMQQRWFEKINNENNFYFIIEFEGKEVGLSQIKDIQNQTGEFGIFIADLSARGKKISYRTNMSLIEYGFNSLGLHTLIVHIKKDNPVSQKVQTNLGFTLEPNQEDILNQLYTLQKDRYTPISL